MGSTVSAKNAFVDILAALTGVRKAPDNPPDSMNVYPHAIAWVAKYDYLSKRKGRILDTGNHILYGRIYIPRKDLSRDIATLEIYHDLVRTALADDPTLNGTVRQILSYEGNILPGQWDSQPQLVYVEFQIGIDIDYC